ncbi:MAG: transcriptional regulator GcvA [Alphaproteobacteria bacterium]|jgi:LysR family glycine cleavage system transcriptional activator|nr:transcriptional regulator GcvA [Alphaproteobacteria bacterium]
MSVRMPPLNALRAFEVAARHRSFSRAADELNVTPAAISHQIKGLEAFIGAKLFRRAGRTLMLTGAGQTMLPGVAKGFAALVEAMEAFGLHDETGQLTVAVTPSFAANWFLHRLERFNRAHPEIDIRISTRRSLAAYEREGVEIGVRYGHGDWPGLKAEHLLSHGVTPVCSPRLLEAERPLARAADLAHVTLLHDDSHRDDPSFLDWASWLAAAGLDGVDPTHGLWFDTAGGAQRAAVQGLGVALGRSTLIADDVAAGLLVCPFELVLATEFAYWIVYPEASIKRPKVRAFRDWLLAEARRHEAETTQAEGPSQP